MRTNSQQPAGPPNQRWGALPPPCLDVFPLVPPTLPPEHPSFLSLWLRRQGSSPPAPKVPGTLCRWQVTRKDTPNWGSAPHHHHLGLCPTPHTKALEPPASPHRHSTPSPRQPGTVLGSRGEESLSPPFHPGNRALLGDAEHPACGGPSAFTPSPAPRDALEGGLLCQPSSLPQHLPVPSPCPRRQGDAPPAQASSAEFFWALAAAACRGTHTLRHPRRCGGVWVLP